jgi:hypothetical protein
LVRSGPLTSGLDRDFCIPFFALVRHVAADRASAFYARLALLQEIAPAAAGLATFTGDIALRLFFHSGGRDDCLYDLSIPSLLQGVADGILGTSDGVLYLARCLFRGAFGLCLRVASHLADDFLDGPLHLMSRTLYPILVHIRSPKLPVINTQFGAWLREATIGHPVYAER